MTVKLLWVFKFASDHVPQHTKALLALTQTL